jgi:uncharacterized protein
MTERTTARRMGVGALPFIIPASAYLIAITLGELLTTFGDVRLGMASHCLILLALLVHSYLARSRPAECSFWVSMAFAPLIRILSLALPLTGFPLLYWYLIISIPLFFGLGTAARSLGLSWPAMGMTLRGWPLQLLIGLTGIIFGVVEYVILRPEPLVPVFTWRAILWPAFVLTICTGLLEEMIFRGLMQSTGRATLGRWNLLYISVLFAVLHIGYKSVIDVAFVLVVGYFFAWVVLRTGSLLGVTIAHGLINTVLFLVMPFLAAGSLSGLARPEEVALRAPTPVPVVVPPASAIAMPATVCDTEGDAPSAPVTPSLLPTPKAAPEVARNGPSGGMVSGPRLQYRSLGTLAASDPLRVLGRNAAGTWRAVCYLEDRGG